MSTSEHVLNVTGATTSTLNLFNTYLIDGTSGSYTFTLESITSLDGVNIKLIRTDSTTNVITIAATGPNIINENATLLLSAQNQVTLISSGGVWNGFVTATPVPNTILYNSGESSLTDQWMRSYDTSSDILLSQNIVVRAATSLTLLVVVVPNDIAVGTGSRIFMVHKNGTATFAFVTIPTSIIPSTASIVIPLTLSQFDLLAIQETETGSPTSSSAMCAITYQ